MSKSRVRSNRGFTLLELLVVVAILAILGGALLVSYDGLEDDAANAHSGFNISASDRAVRTFKALNRNFPNDWDSLLTGDSAVSPFVAADLLDRMSAEAEARLNTGTVTAAEVTSLSAVGITTVRDVDTGAAAVNRYDDDDNFTDDNVDVPNRIFDDGVASTGYYGDSRTLATGASVAVVDTTSELGRLLGLVATDKVVALGIGNNSTINDPTNNGSLSQTPFGRVNLGEYGRFIALFHVSNAAGAFNKARFLGVIDAKGNILDEAVAGFTEGNN